MARLKRRIEPLSDAQLRTLDSLRRPRGARDRIVQALSIRGSFATLAVTRTLESLEKRGLIEDGPDGYRLTQAGRLESARASGRRVEEEAPEG